MGDFFSFQDKLASMMAVPLTADTDSDVRDAVLRDVRLLYAMGDDEEEMCLGQQLNGLVALAVGKSELSKDDWAGEDFLNVEPLMRILEIERKEEVALFERYRQLVWEALEEAHPVSVKRARLVPERRQGLEKKMREVMVRRERQCAEKLMEWMEKEQQEVGMKAVQEFCQMFLDWLESGDNEKETGSTSGNEEYGKEMESGEDEKAERSIFDDLQQERFRINYEDAKLLYGRLIDCDIIDCEQLVFDVFYFSLLRAKFVNWDFLVFSNSDKKVTLSQYAIFIYMIYLTEVIHPSYKWAVAALERVGMQLKDGQRAYNKSHNDRINKFKEMKMQ